MQLGGLSFLRFGSRDHLRRTKSPTRPWSRDWNGPVSQCWVLQLYRLTECRGAQTLVIEFGEEIKFRVATDYQPDHMDCDQQRFNQPQNAMAILQDEFYMGEAVTHILVISYLTPC